MLRTWCHSALTALLYILAGIPVQLGHLARKVALPLHLHLGSWMESDPSIFLLCSWIHFAMDWSLSLDTVGLCLVCGIQGSEHSVHEESNPGHGLMGIRVTVVPLFSWFSSCPSSAEILLPCSLSAGRSWERARCPSAGGAVWFRCRRSHSVARPVGTTCFLVLGVECRVWGVLQSTLVQLTICRAFPE